MTEMYKSHALGIAQSLKIDDFKARKPWMDNEIYYTK